MGMTGFETAFDQRAYGCSAVPASGVQMGPMKKMTRVRATQLMMAKDLSKK